jgi:hypothetical protein
VSQENIDSGRLTSDELKRLLDALGSQNLPGSLTRAYQTARDALRHVLTLPRSDQQRTVKDILTHLRETVRLIAEKNFRRAVELGEAQAKRDAVLLGVALAGIFDREDRINQAVDVIDSETKRQTDAIWLLLLLGAAANQQMILSNAYLTPAPVQKATKFWTATLTNQTFDSLLVTGLKTLDSKYARMAVLGANPNHTQTCLMVNGQIVGLREDFILLGEPRYANKMRSPPFHDHCHTTVAIVPR